MYQPNDPSRDVLFSEQKTIDLSAQPKTDRWRWLIDRNPLFLISGVLMFAGCYLVSGAIHAFDPAAVGERTVLMMLIALLAVLNVYELAVIWLGLALSKTRTLIRDTRHLLGLALLLLVDAAFVYNETSIFSPWIGGLIAGIAAILACVKAWWIVRLLGIRPTRSTMLVTAVTLSAMYALPVCVRALAVDGFLYQPQAMMIWVGLGLVVALHGVPLRWVHFDPAHSDDHAQLQRLIVGGLIALPLMSLFGHAFATLWVYENAFELSMLSPALLGLAAVMLRHPQRLGGSEASAKAAALVVACAVVPSLVPAQGLTYVSTAHHWLAFSPLRGVLLIAPLLLLWAWWIGRRTPIGVLIAVAPWIAALLGHTPTAIASQLKWLIQSAMHWLPRTQLQWGALAITAAFICLITGGWISWRRHKADKPEPLTQDSASV